MRRGTARLRRGHQNGDHLLRDDRRILNIAAAQTGVSDQDRSSAIVGTIVEALFHEPPSPCSISSTCRFGAGSRTRPIDFPRSS